MNPAGNVSPNLPPEMQPVEPKPLLNGRRAGWYAALFALAQMAVVAAAILVTGTQWFLDHDGYPGMRNEGYSQRIGHANCEVLIYGDSSSLTGMDPAVIGQITGMKTCNISEGMTVQGVVGSDVPLEAYLRQNPPPKVLIGMWTPSALRPDVAPMSKFSPEGMAYALEYTRPHGFFRSLWNKQDWIGTFSVWSMHMLTEGAQQRLQGKTSHYDARAVRDERGGQWPYPLPAETHCLRIDYSKEPDTILRYAESVAAFRKKYSTPQTLVLINVAPVPDCDLSYDLYAAKDAGLFDNTFKRMPIGYFNDGDVHFTMEGARLVSADAAAEILARLHMAEGPTSQNRDVGHPPAEGQTAR